MVDLEDFVSDSIHKTPPMKVDVINFRGEIVYSYDAPAGFQLDQYVNSLFPDAEIMVTANHEDITVSVIIKEISEVYQIHRGIYQYNLSN